MIGVAIVGLAGGAKRPRTFLRNAADCEWCGCPHCVFPGLASAKLASAGRPTAWKTRLGYSRVVPIPIEDFGYPARVLRDNGL